MDSGSQDLLGLRQCLLGALMVSARQVRFKAEVLASDLPSKRIREVVNGI